MSYIQLYDTTLRDGAQREGISFSVEDKLKIAQKLDELGIHLIEGGWPGANQKDAEFFARARGLALRNSELVAFGSTRRSSTPAEEDLNLRALVEAGTRTVTIVGKAWHQQVSDVLGIPLEENLHMVAESVSFLKGKGLNVFFDAEHFFDGYKANGSYALEVLGKAAEAGAACLVLCDTNGGSLPEEIASAVRSVREALSVPLGIHTHNDSELAVANSLAAVDGGVTQIQGTINGYGERCGNANLCSIIPALKLKRGIGCVSDEQLAKLSYISHYVSEIANLTPDSHLPYVGASAFAHKAGFHVSAMAKWDRSYQHIDPSLVGNAQRVLISELSGKSNILYKAREHKLPASINGEDARRVLEQVKEMEGRGFQYEGAEASFELLVRRGLPDYRSPFELVDFMVVVEKRRRLSSWQKDSDMLSEATVKVRVGEKVCHTAAEGNGPVNALDAALRRALVQFYPGIEVVKLVDYKVRILDETAGTGSLVRVLIESSDGKEQWRTVGSSSNIIEASWLALTDGLEYWLQKQGEAT